MTRAFVASIYSHLEVEKERKQEKLMSFLLFFSRRVEQARESKGIRKGKETSHNSWTSFTKLDGLTGKLSQDLQEVDDY